MNIDQITAILSTVGFPIISTMALGIFINQIIKHQREDFKRREDILLQQINTLTALVINLNTNKGSENK